MGANVILAAGINIETYHENNKPQWNLRGSSFGLVITARSGSEIALPSTNSGGLGTIFTYTYLL